MIIIQSYFTGLLLRNYAYWEKVGEGRVVRSAYPKHLPQVGVSEAEGDVGHVEAFGGPLGVRVIPNAPSTTDSS